LTFLKQLKTSDFLSFALIISSDESQGKAYFNLQSLGENKTGYRAENIFSTDGNFTHLFTLLLYTLLIMYCNARSLPISHNFHVMLLLVNVMFPTEFCQ